MYEEDQPQFEVLEVFARASNGLLARVPMPHARWSVVEYVVRDKYKDLYVGKYETVTDAAKDDNALS